MSPPDQAPFGLLVEYFQCAFTSAQPVCIPATVLFAFKNATQPLEDTGLQGLVELFEGCGPEFRARLDATGLAQLLQIIFRLQPSLLQQKLIYSVLVPCQKSDPGAFRQWRRSVSTKLIPTILRSIQERALSDALLIVAAHSLALFLGGDEEAIRVVYNGQDTLRHTLGTIVSKYENYAVRVAVANLIREFMKDRFDCSLFWPHGTPAPSIRNFPLADVGDTEWLTNAVEFLGAGYAPKTFHNDPPEVYIVQHSEFGHSVAILSDNLTLALPANTQRSLEFLQLPFLDGMACWLGEGSDNEVTIRYGQATEYQISQGVRRRVEEVRLVMADNAHRIGFAETVKRRVAKKLAVTLPELKLNLPPQRTSYASIDLSQSRETSVDSQEVICGIKDIIEGAVSVDLPSCVENQGAGDGKRRQERTNNTSFSLRQAEINACIQLPATNPAPQIQLALPSKQKQEAAKETAKCTSTLFSDRTNRAAVDTMKDSQRLLKRPSVKSRSNANKTDIDWDEDLRNDEIESKAPASKKTKSTSKKAQKSNNTATIMALKSVPKAGNSQRKAGKAQAKPPVHPTTTTRTRRTARNPILEYVEDAHSEPRNKDNGKPSPVAHDSDPLTNKAMSARTQVNVDDNHSEQDGSDLKSYELHCIENIPVEGTSTAKSPSAVRKTEIVEENAASDSLPMDSMAKVDALAQSDKSFGTRLTLALTAKAHLPVPAIEQTSRRSFGNAKKFVEVVNLTRNGSPQKSPEEETRNTRHDSDKSAINQIPLNDRIPVESTARHSLAQVQAAGTCEHRPETTVADSAKESEQVDNMHAAHEEAVPMNILEEDVVRATSESVPTHSPNESTAPESMQQDSLDLAALAVKKVRSRKTPVTPTTSKGGRDEENQVQHSHILEQSPETELSKPATAASVWLPHKAESLKIIQGILKSAELEKYMDPPTLPHQSERQNRRSSTCVSDDKFDSSLVITDERIQRKTPLVRFGAQGPRNQGMLHPRKQPRLAEASNLVFPEPGERAAASVKTMALPSESITLLTFSAISDEVSSHNSEAIFDDESILVQVETSSESLAMGRNSESDEEDAVVFAEEPSMIELNVGSGSDSRKNASQSSKVDENGSPRLYQPPKLFISPAKLKVAATTSEQLEGSAFASDGLENCVNTEDNSSSPVIVRPEHLQERLSQRPRAKMIETRGSIGLQEVLSEEFPQASKTMNTRAFKRQTKNALCRPAIVVGNGSMVSQQVRNSPDTKLLPQPQVEHLETNHAPPLSSPQNQVSGPSTHIIRLCPRSPADASRMIGKDSPTPAPFNIGFKKMLIPTPTVPPSRQGKRNLTAGLAGKSKKRAGLRTADEDLTLIDDEDSLETKSVLTAAQHQRQQTPESATDSQSPPVPEQMSCRKDSRKENRKSSSPEFRDTQQHILAILNQVVTGMVFRLQAAEHAIQGKTRQYHLGCYTLIEKLETTYEACIQHEKSRTAPRVAGLRESYNNAVESCSRGLRRVRAGPELTSLSEKVEKSRNSLLSLIENQEKEADRSEQEVD